MTSKLLRLAPVLVAGALLLPGVADAKGKGNGNGNGHGHGHGRPAWAGPPAANAPVAADVRTSAAEEPAVEQPIAEQPVVEPPVLEPAPEAPVAEPAPLPVEEPAAPVAPARKGKGRDKPKTFVFGGRVTAVDAAAGTVAVLVRRGNSRGRRFRGEVVTFSLRSALVEGVESDGVAGITVADVLVGDDVAVQARLARAARPDGAAVAARKLVDLTEREPTPVDEPVAVEPEPDPAPEVSEEEPVLER